VLALQRLRLGRPVNDQFFYVYILVSKADRSFHYTGITIDLNERLSMHNRGKCNNTAVYRPWHVETAIAFTSETKARAFEKYLKTGSRREFARHHF
jgi:predicted GIY-YIG superfamily endonuclease